jgi:RNA-directed DNA polymerase
MKIEQTHIDQIRNQFAALQSKEDLVKLLSDAKNMLYGEECKPFKLKSLTYYANPTLCKKRYQTFPIKKKSGADRTIHAPVKGLKSILRSLNFVLQCIYEPHEAATGFVREKSIVDNAKKHVGHHYVFNIDIKDFFHSFDRNKVKLAFMYEPFNLRQEREELAFLLACLCTHPILIDDEIKNVLPQGSPCSPTLTNILCRRLDHRLSGLAKRFGAVYTRYADDITFSSYHNIFKREANPLLNDKGCYDNFIAELERLLSEEGLKINPEKTRLQKAGYRQEATGLIVNEKVNVRRRYVKQIRMWLYYWEKYGYEKAEQLFCKDYLNDKGHVKKGKPNLANVLSGKLEFLKMVKGVENRTYIGLKNRIDWLNKILSSGKTETNITIKVNQNSEELDTSHEHKFNNIKHDPQFVINKLKQFTYDPIMKWTTHFWDIPTENIDKHSLRGIEDHLKAINSRYNEFVALQKYNKNLWWDVIYPFIFQKKLSKVDSHEEIPFKWGKYGLKIGWQYPGIVKDWTVVNYDKKTSATKKTPFEMPILPEHITEEANQKYRELFGKEIRYFGDVVELFKREIEFREETQDFYFEVKSLARQELGEFHIKGLETLKHLSFFTFTSAVLKSIRRIFRMIQTRTEHREVVIEGKKLNDLNHIELRIIHKNSVSYKNSNHNKLTRPSGDLLEVIKNLISVCDFEIESKFNDGNYKIIYLGESNKITYINNQLEVSPTMQLLSDVQGFTYILKFKV